MTDTPETKSFDPERAAQIKERATQMSAHLDGLPYADALVALGIATGYALMSASKTDGELMVAFARYGEWLARFIESNPIAPDHKGDVWVSGKEPDNAVH